MNIEILDIANNEIGQKIKTIYSASEELTENALNKSASTLIQSILSDRELKEMFVNLQNPDYIANISFLGLAKIEESAKVLSENLTRLKTQVELDDFLKKGYNLDINELKQKYKERKLKKTFPNLKFDKIKELYIYPPKFLPTYYDQTKKISIDAFVFRKYLIGVLQMIFNHMDMVICNIGDEGAGKSCKCSQDMFMLWWMMTEMGIIDYVFDISEIFSNTLERFSELEDKYYGVPFRIIGLDEGNELNRQDWKEDKVKLFWQRLRRERHEQRIKFINIPVLGEMIINIVLSRINFIFDMKNRNEAKTGTLYKGDYNFYIIPRGDKIFSPASNRELTKADIKNKLYKNLKDKEYLKGLPTELRIKRCHCNGVWGFEEKDYVKKMKETNRQYTIRKGLNFGLSELYAFYKGNVSPGKMGIKRNEVIYPSMNKMVYKIRGFWNNDIPLLMKFEKMFETKAREKEEDGKQQERKYGIEEAKKIANKVADLVTTDDL